MKRKLLIALLFVGYIVPVSASFIESMKEAVEKVKSVEAEVTKIPRSKDFYTDEKIKIDEEYNKAVSDMDEAIGRLKPKRKEACDSCTEPSTASEKLSCLLDYTGGWNDLGEQYAGIYIDSLEEYKNAIDEFLQDPTEENLEAVDRAKGSVSRGYNEESFCEYIDKLLNDYNYQGYLG